MSTKVSEDMLRRRAVVYIRQSTATQLVANQESKRRQYALRDRARDMGFRDVIVIDEDLGRSGGGLTERPGFQRLVAEVCTGEVGAVLSIEASRLARNGRDWHRLVDLCGLVGALVIDAEGIYDPRIANDRLLLGMKGTMSEFELTLFRQRCRDAIAAKASRGELQFCLPVGFHWSEAGRIELDADRRVRSSIALVFCKYEELGSVRQVLLWFRRNNVTVPTRTYGDRSRPPIWRLPVYNTIHKIITNPMYAGAYAFGRTGERTSLKGDRATKTRGHVKPMASWTVLIKDHHAGYISWQEFEDNQQTLAQNAHMKKRMTPKAGRGGRALLAGMLRCRRCGRMLHVTYSGPGKSVRYSCRGATVNHGEDKCISFGGLRPDEMVAQAILDVISPHAIEAAIEAESLDQKATADRQQALELELEQARYEERLAARRYEQVDPENRLVAGELEIRWNAAIDRVRCAEIRVEECAASHDTAKPKIDRATLIGLANALPTVWNSPAADMRLKQRIVRTIVQEVVADVDDRAAEIVLVVHWVGGRHTEFRAPKNKKGVHSKRAPAEAEAIVRQMASRWPDEQVAATLNRLGLKTGNGNAWNETRIYGLRRRLKLPAYDPTIAAKHATCTLQQAASVLDVSETTVRRLIRDGVLCGVQVTKGAPYEIPRDQLHSEQVRRALREPRRLGAAVRERAANRRTLRLPGLDEA